MTPHRPRGTGDRIVRSFLEVARTHGLLVMMRLGPWDHGGTRNGGFPDWAQVLDTFTAPLARHETGEIDYFATSLPELLLFVPEESGPII
ncbi:beta-galactosidase [Microbacterium sp. NPDC087589]|uniref:beta-galactosidase n=1 Tax=Microbacterium sp. NPDC087589 TaxID=3364191 RepID=UPI00380324D8